MGYPQLMAARWSHPGPLQATILETLAAADGPMTATALYDATGTTHPSGQRAIRKSIAAMEARGWVSVERRTVVAYEGDGARVLGWHEAEPGEEPTHHEGDPVPGRPDEVFTADVVVERQARPVIGTVVALTAAGRRALAGAPSAH